MMNRKQIVLPLIAAVSLVLPVAATAQNGFASNTQQTTQQGKKIKPVKFTLQNKSASTLELKSGDEPVTLAAGESKVMQAPAGTRIVTASESSRGAAGTVVAQISGDMNGSTIDLH
ncbi:hypothetical protein FTO74_12430 [Granulicella sp. WH15]|uniref:hypothetical protein n=1 Tax=Granulicella sp. WH15 TaxID=2602070 RepID=UPI001366BA8E|nr:hypothetical protein [Granulicella sp. WH15]QHN04088.1 hypothetical protein FTO74_12430 [Granulicella sp. WH15]